MKNTIALLTDFGTKDYYVGAMKGVILSINENANIIDISHEIEPQNVNSAGFNLNACYKDFSRKTIFVAVVDPGVGSSRRAILVETEDYYFIAPDNGLLSFIFRNEKNITVYELTNRDYFYPPVRKTFHGRDIFAPVAAHLSNGVFPEDLGIEINDYKQFKIRNPKGKEDGTTEAEILHIDTFGNIITNIEKSDLSNEFTLSVGTHTITELRTYFSEGRNGKIGDVKDRVFMLFGSLNLLEVVVYQDSAAKILKAKVGQKIYVKT